MTSSPWKIDPITGHMIAPAGTVVRGISTLVDQDAITRGQTDATIQISLDDYYDKTETDALLVATFADYYTKAETNNRISTDIANALVDYYDKTETDSRIATELASYYTKVETNQQIDDAVQEQGTVDGQATVTAVHNNVGDGAAVGLSVPIAQDDLVRLIAYCSIFQGGEWKSLDRSAIVQRIGAAAPITRTQKDVWEWRDYEPQDPALADQYYKSTTGTTSGAGWTTVASNSFTVEAGDYMLSCDCTFVRSNNNQTASARVLVGGVPVYEINTESQNADWPTTFSINELLPSVPAGTLDVELQLAETGPGDIENRYFTARLVKKPTPNLVKVVVFDLDPTHVRIEVLNNSGSTVDQIKIAGVLYNEDIS